MATAAATAIGRAMVYQRWAKCVTDEDRRAATAPGRTGFDKRFYREAYEMHPHASEREIERCVAALKHGYYANLQRLSCEARAAKKRSSSGSSGRAATCR